MKKNIIFVCLLFSLCFFLQCAAGQSKDLEYFPMLPGAKWEYVVKSKTGDGAEQTAKFVKTVGGETVIGGKTYREIVLSSADNPPLQSDTSNFYRIDKNGIYVVSGVLRDKFKIDDEYLFAPLPLTEKPWTIGKNKVTTEVKAEKAGDLRVGETLYQDCLKMTDVTTTLNDESRLQVKTTGVNFYARGIGLIKSDAKTEFVGDKNSPAQTIEYQLEKYSPKN